MVTHIYSHSEVSEGARELSRALDIRRIKHENSRYAPARGKSIINWGSSRMPPELANGASRVINSPFVVARVSNKLEFFKILEADDTCIYPEWTTDIVVARQWSRENNLVVARTILSGHSGAGIVLCGSNGVDIPRALLYTKYVKKRDEFRVHIMKDEVIDVQAKKKQADFEGANFQIRNHANGFVYCRNEINVPNCVQVQALNAFKASGLDFGAIDVIYNANMDTAYVLEINTAPGLQGQTVEIYRDAFKRHFGV